VRQFIVLPYWRHLLRLAIAPPCILYPTKSLTNPTQPYSSLTILFPTTTLPQPIYPALPILHLPISYFTLPFPVYSTQPIYPNLHYLYIPYRTLHTLHQTQLYHLPTTYNLPILNPTILYILPSYTLPCSTYTILYLTFPTLPYLYQYQCLLNPTLSCPFPTLPTCLSCPWTDQTANCLVRELTSPRFDQSAIWFVRELTSNRPIYRHIGACLCYYYCYFFTHFIRASEQNKAASQITN